MATRDRSSGAHPAAGIVENAWLKGMARNKARHWFRSQGRWAALRERLAVELERLVAVVIQHPRSTVMAPAAACATVTTLDGRVRYAAMQGAPTLGQILREGETLVLDPSAQIELSCARSLVFEQRGGRMRAENRVSFGRR